MNLLIHVPRSVYTGISSTAVALLKFMPDCTVTDEELKLVKEQYEADLPSPELLASELVRWRIHLSNHAQTLTKSITAVLDMCDIDIFPNVNTLLRLAATLPVTTCECERSFSTLRRLNTYLRNSQTSERLDSLALINIHCENQPDTDKVIDLFAKLHPRRMELSSVIFEASD